MQGALASVDGVESVEVDFATKQATVMGNADSAAMLEALQKAGFDGSVKK